MAVGADYLLVPEHPTNLDEMCEVLMKRRKAGKTYGIVVASEGAVLSQTEGLVTQNAKIDDFGHVSLGGIGQLLADIIEKKTGVETRFVVLGHVQRGGAPSAYDRVLGTRLGVAAGRLILEKKFGRMVALSGTKVVDVALADAVGQLKTLTADFYRDAMEFCQ